MNLCLMAKRDSDSNKDQVGAPTYDALLHICEQLYVVYKHMKRKHSSQKKNFVHLEKIHSMTIIELQKFKISLDELKIKNSRIKCKFFERLDSLTDANEILKKGTR